jgi:putative exosortase-associated protein (TIGR04073 family)
MGQGCVTRLRVAHQALPGAKKCGNEMLRLSPRSCLTDLEVPMKNFVVLALILAGAGVAVADIQDPPSNDYGPTRKLGRGLSNFFLAPAEITVTVATINKQEGNAAAAGYGVVRAVGRSATRHVAGFLEIITWAAPVWRSSYYPLLPSDIPYIHAGYSEFPPELGNESKYPYVRDY